MFLREIQFLWERVTDEQRAQYPVHLPAYQGVESMEINGAVTFFVGENGTGKSTLLEAIAALCEFPTGGGEVLADEHSVSEPFPLQDMLRLSWMPKVRTGFFMRAETYYNFASLLDERMRDPDFAADPYARYGGKSLHKQSHGESFLKMFETRFSEKGLYLLDEPEAALSPVRQLSFLRLMKQMADTGKAQFIICTHSPILLGYPGAEIFTFDRSPLQRAEYEETEHYTVTRYFLNNRQEVLRELFKREDDSL
ncbi:AAA family ATPase [Tumebacillus sp. DT12]|uniref:AAA family ATPase n=1 Tax=Tumebacillus lacus TaxID=2995335 RepID=A0ABT3WUI5_9BACL|nr:AAA family ATPase [Tumebacillus lacus]MCX7568363.1 AAA family ATPase [Tumebacillus lacus]